MSTPLLQCVPNVSEGRDEHVIEMLAHAVDTTGARLVDVHRDADHHRSVFTLLGPSSTVEQGVLSLARAAVAHVDLTRHRGVHPRVGAVDVIPFVPMRGSTMSDAVSAAHRVGRTMAAELGVPVFYYGEACGAGIRRELPALRRGGFEALAARLADPAWRPDEGPPAPHPTAGITVVGARGPLIAFNAMLDTAAVEVAVDIARVLRESSGGLPAVRAMGVLLASHDRAQVSMNLLDYHRTAVTVVARYVKDEARRRGHAVLEYELVGCAPADALADWPEELAPIAGLKPSQLLDPSLFPA